MPSTENQSLKAPARSTDSSADQGSFVKSIATLVAVLAALVPATIVWDNGGQISWTRYWASIAVGVLGLISLPLVAIRGHISFARVLWIPALAGLAWFGCYAQTLSLPAGLASWISPGSAHAYQQDIPEVVYRNLSVDPRVAVDGAWHPASLSRWKTWQAMYLPALFGMAVYMGIFLFAQRRALTTLLLIVAIAGGIFSFLAIADNVRAGGRKPGQTIITPTGTYGTPFGSFVNKNSAGLFINLGIACTLGLLVTAAKNQRRAISNDETYELPSSGLFESLQSNTQRFLKDATATTVALVVLAILQMVAILASQSRGAFIAAIIGFVCVIAATSRKGKYTWSVPLVLVVTVSVTLILEQLQIADITGSRVQSIFALQGNSQAGRLSHWKESLITGFHYLPAGSGLGTYSLAYLPYQANSGSGWFYNADNMYCEWFVEGGIWLLSLIAVGTWLFIGSLRRLRRVHRAPHLSGLISTGWYMLSMLAVSQFFDFGILYPANFLTVGLLVGAVLAADARDFKRQRDGWLSMKDAQAGPDAEVSEQTPRIWPWLWTLSAFYVVVISFTIRRAYEDAWTDFEIRSLNKESLTQPVSEHPVVRAVIARELTQPSADETPASLTRRERLESFYKPFFDQNPELQIALARAILRRQEQLAILAVAGKLTTAEIKDYRQFVGIDFRRSVYYGRARQEGKDQVSPAEALLPGQSLAELKLARTLAQRAMVQSPLDVLSRYVLLQTSFVDPEPPETSRLWVEQCQRLWPNSPSVLVSIARLAAVSPADKLSLSVVEQALRQQPTAVEQLWPFIEQLPSVESRDQALPDDPRVLILAIESKLPDRDAKDHLADRLRTLCEQGSSDLPESRMCYIRGRLECYSENLSAAVASLSRGVLLEPNFVEMRFLYCEVLQQLGDIEGAIEQARACTGQAPKNLQYQNKLRELQEQRRNAT